MDRQFLLSSEALIIALKPYRAVLSSKKFIFEKPLEWSPAPDPKCCVAITCVVKGHSVLSKDHWSPQAGRWDTSGNRPSLRQGICRTCHQRKAGKQKTEQKHRGRRHSAER